MEVRLPKKPDWDSDVESWTESEGTSSSECEHNVESLALNGKVQDQSGEKISLFLEDWRYCAKEALSCHIALGMLCLGMEAW